MSIGRAWVLYPPAAQILARYVVLERTDPDSARRFKGQMPATRSDLEAWARCGLVWFEGYDYELARADVS